MTVLQIVQMGIWVIVLNFGVCNQIWTEPVDYWWAIEIAVGVVSYLMTMRDSQSFCVRRPQSLRPEFSDNSEHSDFWIEFCTKKNT